MEGFTALGVNTYAAFTPPPLPHMQDFILYIHPKSNPIWKLIQYWTQLILNVYEYDREGLELIIVFHLSKEALNNV